MTVTRNELTSSRFATCAINRYAIGAVALELFPIRFCYTAAPWALQTNVLEWSIPWVATDWPGQTGFFLLEKIKLQGYSAAFSPFGNSIGIKNGGRFVTFCPESRRNFELDLRHSSKGFFRLIIWRSGIRPQGSPVESASSLLGNSSPLLPQRQSWKPCRAAKPSAGPRELS